MRVYTFLASENQNNNLRSAPGSPNMSPRLNYGIGQIKRKKYFNARQFMALNSITFWDYRFVGQLRTFELLCK